MSWLVKADISASPENAADANVPFCCMLPEMFVDM